MNIFLRELKAHYKSFLIWSAAMIFLIAGGMMKFSAFAKTGEAVNALLKSMPPALMQVMGLEPGADLSSIGVFYSIFYLYFLLLMSVYSCLLGAGIIAKEERDKTADFLLVKPIRRRQAVTAKVLAALSMVVLYNFVTFIASVMFTNRFNEIGQPLTGPIFMLSLALLVVQVLFLSIGLFLGAISQNYAKAAGLVTAIILGTFILNVLIDLKDDLNFLTFLTPYSYFQSFDVMFDHRMPVGYLVLSGAIIIVMVAGTYHYFQKRDLRC